MRKAIVHWHQRLHTCPLAGTDRARKTQDKQQLTCKRCRRWFFVE